jgi:hypothetical protein
LAHARDIRHHLAITTAEQAAISGTAEHASAVVLKTWIQKNMWVWNGSEMSKATRASFINRRFVKKC